MVAQAYYTLGQGRKIEESLNDKKDGGGNRKELKRFFPRSAPKKYILWDQEGNSKSVSANMTYESKKEGRTCPESFSTIT